MSGRAQTASRRRERALRWAVVLIVRFGGPWPVHVMRRPAGGRRCGWPVPDDLDALPSSCSYSHGWEVPIPGQGITTRSIPVKRFACGDVVPGCAAIFQDADEAAILARVAVHAHADHEVHEMTDDLVEAVLAAIH